MEPKPNIFQEYNLSEEEVIVALTSFNDYQYALIQTERATIARQKLTLEVVNGDVKEFERQHVFQAGQLAFAGWLLNSIELNAKEREEKSKEQSTVNKDQGDKS